MKEVTELQCPLCAGQGSAEAPTTGRMVLPEPASQAEATRVMKKHMRSCHGVES